MLLARIRTWTTPRRRRWWIQWQRAYSASKGPRFQWRISVFGLPFLGRPGARPRRVGGRNPPSRKGPQEARKRPRRGPERPREPRRQCDAPAHPRVGCGEFRRDQLRNSSNCQKLEPASGSRPALTLSRLNPKPLSPRPYQTVKPRTLPPQLETLRP